MKSLLVFMTLFSTVAFAEIVQVPGSTGVLVNHTALPSDAFKIDFTVSCRTVKFEDCGRFEVEKNLNADGTYEIPAFELDAGSTKPADRQYSLFVFLNLPQEDARFPKGVAPGDLANLYEQRRVSKVKDVKALNFTLFRANPGPLDVQLKSGRDLNEFLKNEGRDVGVTIQIDFGLSGTENFSTTASLEQTGFSRKRWVDLRETYFLMNGELAADAEFDFDISYGYQSVKSGRLRFDANLVKILGSFTIDDVPAQTEQLPAERKLTGEFADTNFFLDYGLRDKFKFAEIGFSYATLKAECVNGQIKGELIYRDGQIVDDPETSRVAVGGTCQGERGTLTWPIETISGQTVILSADFARIRAQTYEKNNGQTTIGRLLFTEDIVDDQAKYKADELSMFLTVRLPDGSYAGHISVGTDN